MERGKLELGVSWAGASGCRGMPLTRGGLIMFFTSIFQRVLVFYTVRFTPISGSLSTRGKPDPALLNLPSPLLPHS
jgi:hypothetical protein